MCSLELFGLYGVIAYSVGQRTYEIGIRMAVGASSGQVLRMVLRQGLALSGTAAVLGIILAMVLSQANTGNVWYVNPLDPPI